MGSKSLTPQNLDRPALTAIGGPPGRDVLDLAMFVKLLIKIRATSPDLADDLFQLAIHTVMAGKPPIPTEIGELSVYLFPGSESVPFGESLLHAIADRHLKTLGLVLPTMPNLTSAKFQSSPDMAAIFFANAIRVIESYDSDTEDPVGAFALACQLAPKAHEFAPNYEARIESEVDRLKTAAGPDAPAIQAALSAVAPNSKAANTESAMLMEIKGLWKDGDYAAARANLSALADGPARRQIEALIRFGEAVRGVDPDTASRIADRPLLDEPGVKRSLVYAMAATLARNQTDVPRALSLGVKDIEGLPASQQICTLTPLAAVQTSALNRNLAILEQAVKSANEVFATNASDAALDIRCQKTGPVEYVRIGDEVAAFRLTLPAGAVFSISSVVQRADAVDSERLERVISELRDPIQQAEALLVLADLRFRSISH